jgi:hypothetical protein
LSWESVNARRWNSGDVPFVLDVTTSSPCHTSCGSGARPAREYSSTPYGARPPVARNTTERNGMEWNGMAAQRSALPLPDAYSTPAGLPPESIPSHGLVPRRGTASTASAPERCTAQRAAATSAPGPTGAGHWRHTEYSRVRSTAAPGTVRLAHPQPRSAPAAPAARTRVSTRVPIP